MQKTEVDILRYLDERREWRTSKMLSAHFDVSVRKIKYIISRLNSRDQLVLSGKRGYMANPQKKQEIEEYLNQTHYNEEVGMYASGRQNLLIKKLLLEEIGIDILDTCEELYTNPTTLRHELIKIRTKLQQFDLDLKMENSRCAITGCEKGRRKLMSSLLSNEAIKGFVIENVMVEMFQEEEIQFVRHAVKDSLDSCGCYVNEYAFMNLLIHLLIVIDRNRKGYCLHNTQQEICHVSSSSAKASEQIFQKIAVFFNQGLARQEIMDFSLLLESQSTGIEHERIDEYDLKKTLGNNVYTLVEEIVRKVNEVYYLDLSENAFLVKFALHIENLLLRIRLDRFSTNPYVEYIKSACPLIYEVSVFIADIIYMRTKNRINDNEIAFLALHLSCIFDKSMYSESHIHAVLVCPSYHDLSQHILQKIQNRCKEHLLVTAVVNNERELDLHQNHCDLILSTISLTKHYRKEIVYFSFMLNGRELEEIATVSQRVLKQRELDQFHTTILSLFSRHLFFHNEILKVKEDILHFMCEHLEAEGYTDSSYYDRVMEREAMSCTVFGKTAVPHALKACAKHSGICVYTSDHGILWEGRQVYIILLIAIHPEDQLRFNEFFNKITERLCEDDKTARLISCVSYEEFLEALVYSQ